MADTEENGRVCQLREQEHVSEVVLRAIAAVSNRPLLELSPLQESIDLDSLDRLFESSSTIGSLQFEYEGYEVTIEPERVRVHERR